MASDFSYDEEEFQQIFSREKPWLVLRRVLGNEMKVLDGMAFSKSLIDEFLKTSIIAAKVSGRHGYSGVLTRYGEQHTEPPTNRIIEWAGFHRPSKAQAP